MIYPISHIRSFCLSFLLFAITFTLVNFLTTTTSINRLTITTTIEPTFSSTQSIHPILLANFSDIHCHSNHDRQRLRHKKLNAHAKKKLLSFIPTQLIQPHELSDNQNPIPYDYDLWQSSPLMPRLVSRCEYKLMIELLKRFDQLARKYSLEYMMSDGTLLGSWRHHDLIPWDDDIDLLMSVKDKSRLVLAIALESPLLVDRIEFHRRWDGPKEFEYYKFYFSASPRFSEHPWRYPFVDLIFYHENQTHLWPENMQKTSSILKKTIFPLELRPYGPLWLPAPRLPHEFLLAVNWSRYDRICINGDWSHKYERLKYTEDDQSFHSAVYCQDLQEFYPFVQRSSSKKQEHLVLNRTIIQIMQMDREKN